MKDEKEPVMYIIVNTDLKMNKGKIAAQSCHSVCKIMKMNYGPETPNKWFTQWFTGSYTKIVLKSNTYTMMNIIKNYPDICSWTFDEGRTQIKKGSLTTIAFIPMPRDSAPKELSDMKLL